MLDPAVLVTTAIAVAAVSGAPGLFLRHGPLGQRFASFSAVLASLLALPALLYMLVSGTRSGFVLEWLLPFGPCEIALDPLSLFFLIPIFLIFPAGSIYALGYWPAASHRNSERSVTFFYGLLAAAMALVVVARNGALLLLAWEVMALSGYFLLITEHDEPEVRKAGTVYLVASHLGAAALLLLFSQLRSETGSFLFPTPGSLPIGASASLIFLAALAGFGSKAGIMPLHIWLPSAHANAPSHVSALLSGVMLKIGVYGVLRVISFFPVYPLWWGVLLLVAGLLSAMVGIAVASVQKDMKRLLAYSSIENLGIVMAGIGMWLSGVTLSAPRLAFLGLAGALFHLLNHSLFKPLLFFGSGCVIHATGTRDMDRMGGLARRMPRTALLVLVGAVAICGLPPFNGFAGEFLLYLGFFSQASAPAPYLALGAPLLALAGGIAVLSFVKMYGISFLGSARSAGAEEGHEAPGTMLAPMLLLALFCLAGGMFPELFLSLVDPVVLALTPVTLGQRGLGIDPVWFTLAGAVLLGVAGFLFWYLKTRKTAGPAATGPTWGCGYLAPTPRMQYSATSFGAFFNSIAKPMIRTHSAVGAIAGVAPVSVSFQYLPEETILSRMIQPAFRVIGVAFSFLRRLQHGEVQIYILYIFATLVVLLLW